MTATETTEVPTQTDDALARYHRQMLLPGFGEEGQKKLLNSTALVVGQALAR